MDEHFDFTDTQDDASAVATEHYADSIDDTLGDAVAAPEMPSMPSMVDEDFSDPVAAPGMPAMPTMDPEPTDGPDPTVVPVPDDAADPAPTDVPADDGSVPVPEDGTYGTPTAWTADWFFQEVNGYCGPSSIAQVVSEYTGLSITDPQQLVDRALELGLFPNDDPSMGMTSADMEILMEDQGVPCHLENSSMQDLQAKLSDGYGVIVMVDSGEIWYPGEETVEDDTADHALVVAGIDEERGVVILSDPGNPDGNQFEISVAEFDNAWADSDHEMLVADNTDPDLADAGTVDPDLAALAPRPWAIIPLT